MNFFVLLHGEQGHAFRRLDISREIQEQLEPLFRQQEVDFLNGVDEVTEFNGGWKPDENEHLRVSSNPQAQAVAEVIRSNPTSVQAIGASELKPPLAKAIFTGEVGRYGVVRVLMQRIDPRKYLSPTALFALIAKQDRLVRLEEPVLSLDNQLLCVTTDDAIRFRSFHNLKMVFDLKDLYKEATDQDISALAGHEHIEVGDLSKLMANADTQVRKLLYSIKAEGVLDRHTPDAIKEAGSRLGFNLSVTNGKLVIPQDKKELKALLRFLDDSIYEAELTGNRYETNSKRRMNS
ncbi:MAG: DUF4868 domain-containing protein [Magnetococcus sp. WYHC-3]